MHCFVLTIIRALARKKPVSYTLSHNHSQRTAESYFVKNQNTSDLYEKSALLFTACDIDCHRHLDEISNSRRHPDG